MNIQESIQKIAEKADSATTYCLGGGLAGLSCYAEKMQPIIADIGLLIGIVGCLLKGYYDYKKHKRGRK